MVISPPLESYFLIQKKGREKGRDPLIPQLSNPCRANAAVPHVILRTAFSREDKRGNVQPTQELKPLTLRTPCYHKSPNDPCSGEQAQTCLQESALLLDNKGELEAAQNEIYKRLIIDQ